jgi:hypothetical protein
MPRIPFLPPDVAPAAPPLLSEAALCDALEISVDTLTLYLSQGMPAAQTVPALAFRFDDCWAWHQYHGARVASGVDPAVLEAPVSLQHVLLWMAAQESELVPEVSGDYVMVPLRHDHPRRVAQLQLACAGLPARSAAFHH